MLLKTRKTKQQSCNKETSPYHGATIFFVIPFKCVIKLRLEGKIVWSLLFETWKKILISGTLCLCFRIQFQLCYKYYYLMWSYQGYFVGKTLIHITSEMSSTKLHFQHPSNSAQRAAQVYRFVYTNPLTFKLIALGYSMFNS